MVNSKSLQLFKFVVLKNIINIKLLTNEILISEKKLRYELSILRDYLILKKFGRLNIQKGNVIIELNKEIDFIYENIKNDSNFNSIERQDYIYFKLLTNKSISLNKISQELNISKVTCRRDLNKLSKEFNKDIRIKLDKTYYLKGNEIEIRQKGVDILLKYLDKDMKKIVGSDIEILNDKVYSFLEILTNN
ncbi:DeoR family transcriptional regulator, partial [Oceanivirga salmonicida]